MSLAGLFSMAAPMRAASSSSDLVSSMAADSFARGPARDDASRSERV
jgi:hypothetical protein